VVAGPWDDGMMQTRLKSYAAYGIGSAVAWLVVLAITSRTTDERRQRAVRLTCAGWWLGWLSATIARQIYPPPGGKRA